MWVMNNGWKRLVSYQGFKVYGLGLFIGQKIWNAHVHYMSLAREEFYSLS
jgi:hypothetical protein